MNSNEFRSSPSWDPSRSLTENVTNSQSSSLGEYEFFEHLLQKEQKWPQPVIEELPKRMEINPHEINQS